MSRHDHSLAVITPVLPGRDRYLTETAGAVAAARAALEGAWRLEWVIVIDGPGNVVAPDGMDRLIHLPLHAGIAAARNVALAHTGCEWVYPLDADDLIDADGLRAVVDKVGSRCAWVATNRLRTDGTRTAHWRDQPHEWPHGALPDYWQSPFIFHPGSLLVRRQAALAVGGWPALPSNEGVAFALGLGAKYAGRFRPEVVTLERDWEGQANRDSVYAQAKEISFGAIATFLAARHGGTFSPPEGCVDPEHMQVDRDT